MFFWGHEKMEPPTKSAAPSMLDDNVTVSSIQT